MREGWVKTSLSAIAVVGAGNSAPQNKALFTGGKYPFFRTSDVGRIHVGTLTESEDRLNEKGISRLTLHPAGTILVPKSGASTFLDHRVIMGVDGYVSSHLATVRAKPHVIDTKYLFYYLLTVEARSLGVDTAYPTLSLSQVNDIGVPFPLLPEQQRIVAILDEAFAGLATATTNAEKNLKSARELFESYLNSIFTQQRHEWSDRTLGEVCDLISGQHINAKDYNTKGKGLGYLTGPSDFGPIHPIISKWTEVPKRMAAKGDILITVKGSGVGSINLLNADSVAISRQLMAVRAKGSNRDLLYFFLSLQKDYFQSKTNGAAIPGISREDVLSLPISMPERATQDRVVSEIKAFEAYVLELEKHYQERLSDIAELKQSILQKAFSGELTSPPSQAIKEAAE